MAEIHIVREHPLGMDRAREVVRQWIARLEQDQGLRCTYEEGRGAQPCDQIRFSGALGLTGTVALTPQRIGMQVQLDFVLGGFAPMIEQKVSRRLDELLAAAATDGQRHTSPPP